MWAASFRGNIDWDPNDFHQVQEETEFGWETVHEPLNLARRCFGRLLWYAWN